MYIYKKRINGKIYYYLRISKNDGNKTIVKDICSLGANIELFWDKINSLDKKYSADIRKSHHILNKNITHIRCLEKVKKLKLRINKFLTKEQLLEIEASNLHFKELSKKLNKKTYDNFLDAYLSEYAWNTASIEGNTIPLKDAEKFFFENKSPKDYSIDEVYDLRNNKEGLNEIFSNYSELDISEDVIIKLHKIIVRDVDKRIGFRSFDVRVIGSGFKSSPFQFISNDIKDLIEWYNVNKNTLNPFVLGLMFHHKFEKIHPFADGNGRVGRLLINLILLKFNYAPLMILRKNRDMYRNTLKIADKNNYEPFISYCVDELVKVYWKSFV